jgi:hypothetical protein
MRLVISDQLAVFNFSAHKASPFLRRLEAFEGASTREKQTPSVRGLLVTVLF